MTILSGRPADSGKVFLEKKREEEEDKSEKRKTKKEGGRDKEKPFKGPYKEKEEVGYLNA